MNNKFFSDKELDTKKKEEILEIVNRMCPDNELSLDDLDSVSGGTIDPKEAGINDPFYSNLYLMIIAFNIEPEDNINSIGLIKNRIATKVKDITGEELSPALEAFTENALREYFANKP